MHFFLTSLPCTLCRCIIITVFLSIGTFLGQEVFADEIRVLTPPPEGIYYAKLNYKHLVIKLTDNNDLNYLKVETTSGETIQPIGKWEKQGAIYVHFRLPLKAGKNLFEINPGKQYVKVTFKPLRSLLNLNLRDPSVHLFHKREIAPAECSPCHNENLPKDAQITPLPFGDISSVCYSCHRALLENVDWKHSPTTNVFCTACHLPESSVKQNTIIIPAGKVETLCFRCHTNQKKWKDMPHVHGPAGTGDCTVCHNPHGDKYKFQLWAPGERELCVACHDDKKFMLYKDRRMYVHGIVSGTGCTSCHDPHATEYRFQLYKPISKLCTSCHTKLAGLKRGHPIAKHPLAGPKDPLREGRRFTCTSCHNPHGNKNKYMLVGELVGQKVCIKCHQRGNKK